MLESSGRLIHHRRRWVLAAAAVFVVIAAVWGTQVFGSLKSGGFEDPHSESARATALIDQRIGPPAGDLVVLYESASRTVDDPAFRDAVTGTLARLPRDQVRGVTSFWSTGSPAFVSRDRHATYVAVRLSGADVAARVQTYEKVRDAFAAPGLTTLRGGTVAVNGQLHDQTSKDLARAEMISMPILLVLLVVIFGSVVSALLPLAIGGVAILGAFTVLRVATMTTDVSTFAVNIVTMLGLGLAIDYSLFIVTRFREELGRADSEREALTRTMATAGRTVGFSGITVAIAFGGLLLFPQMFLRSMGLGGIAVVLVDMVAALTVLPALLAVLGRRVDALRVLPKRRADREGRGAWFRLAHSVMRRPVAYAVGATIVLLALGAPFLGIRFGSVDVRALPSGAEGRTVATALDRDFAHGALSPIDVVVTGGVPRPQIDAYLGRLRGVPGVTGAEVADTGRDATHLAVRTGADAQSGAARDLVRQIRSLPAPGTTYVGGETAQLTDMLSSLGHVLPWAALFVGVVTFALLFAALGSILLPLKALVMNALSLSAAFGVMVWGFQDGHLAGVLGFTSTGNVEASQPVLILAVAFGLSMDYELFLLSRIREEWQRTEDSTGAVAAGLQSTGRIITNAALLLAVVIAAFTTSGISFIKLIGVGLLVAVVVDATLVRALLVPATMRLLGRANWWLPSPLRRLHARVALRESA
ncbi:MMPL family transporter [Actinoallomurus rhizosphaericola]|uniref:MMPL family transporter n=1 Tax=Actinoallomurus rhizosphaericola TaxID=2952536 RepID=UPI002091244F|nr:MMPL family transporter [Actinoallomurus rhizosphaericola]MCO5992184.1 MMPL family transporter [Actinoallomurus rhizosphaericola]